MDFLKQLGMRKFFICLLGLGLLTILLANEMILAEQFMSGLKMILGLFVGGNVLEHVSKNGLKFGKK